MKKLPLLIKLFIAIGAGVLIGCFLPAPVIRVLNSFSATFGQFIRFIVPFIIVGLVTPAIAEAGRSAGRLLLMTMALAYASTLLSGAFAFFVSQSVFPSFLGGGTLSGNIAANEFSPYFKFAVPPVMDVTTALAVSFMFGLGMASFRSETLERAFCEMKEIVTKTIAAALVPFLPLYILAVMADLTASGKLAVVGGSCVKIMLVAVATSLAVLVFQYSAAGFLARRNPFKALAKMLPAYFTGWGSCSSAATIPVTLNCTKSNGISDEVADIVIPLCANIHLSGSMSNMVVYAAGLMVLSGEATPPGAFAEFIFMVSVVAVASPGVPGGVVLACSTITEIALGFSPERYALMIAIYMALDGMGTACNLTGDGAIAMIVERFKSPRPSKI